MVGRRSGPVRVESPDCLNGLAVYYLMSQVRQGLPENFPTFYATGRNFATLLTFFFQNTRFSFVSHRIFQHDPKKLEFIYNLRSRRPGTSGIPKGNRLSNAFILLSISQTRHRQRGCDGIAPRAAAGWTLVVVVGGDERPQVCRTTARERLF